MVEVDVGGVRRWPGAARGGACDGERDGDGGRRTERAAVEDDGAELPLNETIKRNGGRHDEDGDHDDGADQPAVGAGPVAAVSRAEPVVGPLGDRRGASPRAGRGRGRGSPGAVAPGGGGRTGRGGAPADSRARRTALSIAPRAR